jgi:hypothetical protein
MMIFSFLSVLLIETKKYSNREGYKKYSVIQKDGLNFVSL